MSTSVLEAMPGKLDIKRHSPSILYFLASLAMSTKVLEVLPGKLDIKRHSPSILYIYGKISPCCDKVRSNQPAQLHRLAGILKFCCSKYSHTLQRVNKKV